MKISYKVENLGEITKMFAEMPREAEFAQRTALRAAGRTARSGAAKAIAAKWGLVQKVLTKRLQAFPRIEGGVRYVALWFGIKHRPMVSGKEHPSVKKAILARVPNAEVHGKRVVVDQGGELIPARLPIDEGADAIMIYHATEAMRERYPAVLRGDYQTRLKRLARKRGRKR